LSSVASSPQSAREAWGREEPRVRCTGPQPTQAAE
jgi:hypothetical protein